MNDQRGMIDRFKEHWLVLLASLCAAVFASSLALAYFIAIEPCRMWLDECHKQKDELATDFAECNTQKQEVATQIAECNTQKEQLATEFAESRATCEAVATPITPTSHTFHVQVSASVFPYANTDVFLEEGDDVQIVVQGLDPNWNCGKGSTSPEGFFGDRWDRHVHPSANQCELIGYVREGVPFRIGAYEQFVATESGFLHLGANDDPAQMGDNSGSLEVDIIVTKQEG